MTTEEKMFDDNFIYRCSVCGAWISAYTHSETYNLARDSIICNECSTELKIGDGIKGSDGENPGDLDGSLFFVCPVCNSSINEDHMPRDSETEDEGIFVCPACGFKGRHVGGIE